MLKTEGRHESANEVLLGSSEGILTSLFHSSLIFSKSGFVQLKLELVCNVKL